MQKRELALKVFAYDVKQVLMVRYARERKVALWVKSDHTSANNSTSATTTVRFAKGDLENDLNTDLVLRPLATGENVVWLMNGATRKSNVLVTPDPQSLDWTIAGVDDFNKDNRNDRVFWNSTTGAVDFWIMGGPTGTDRQGSPVPLAGAQLPPWKPSATADFNHDNKPDLVYRNFTTQKIEIWTMNGTSYAGTIIPTPDQAVAANWEIVGAQDWNADTNTDFLWYNATSGKIEPGLFSEEKKIEQGAWPRWMISEGVPGACIRSQTMQKPVLASRPEAAYEQSRRIPTDTAAKVGQH